MKHGWIRTGGAVAVGAYQADEQKSSITKGSLLYKANFSFLTNGPSTQREI